jgi:hypothetical protein
VTGLLLMFVMLPLMTLGTIYLIGRQAMAYLDMPKSADQLDAAGRYALNKVGRRTRSKMAFSQG